MDFLDRHFHDIIALLIFFTGVGLVVADFGAIGLTLIMSGLTALGMNSARRPRNGNDINNIT